MNKECKKTISIRIYEQYEPMLKNWGNGSISAGVNEVIARLIEHEKSASYEVGSLLSPNEWKFLADVLNGFNPEGVRFSKSALSVECMDAEKFDGKATRWGVSIPELVKKINSMPTTCIDAIYREVEKFWNEQPDLESWANSMGSRMLNLNS